MAISHFSFSAKYDSHLFKYDLTLTDLNGPFDYEKTSLRRKSFYTQEYVTSESGTPRIWQYNKPLVKYSGVMSTIQGSDVYHWLNTLANKVQFIKPYPTKFCPKYYILIRPYEDASFVQGIYTGFRYANKAFKKGDSIILVMSNVRPPIGEWEKTESNIWEL